MTPRLVSFHVNGEARQIAVLPQRSLLDALRNEAGLTGTKKGCDVGECGSCTVIMNGLAVKSCTVLAAQADGAEITTIEGLAKDGQLHPIQEGFWEEHGLQCGFCTPGMIMSAVDMVNRRGHDLDEKTIREDLDGNICRCTGYHNIVKAIAAGAEAMGKGAAPARQAAE